MQLEYLTFNYTQSLAGRYQLSHSIQYLLDICLLFSISIPIFSQLEQPQQHIQDYFHLFDAKIMLVEYVFNTFIFMIVTNIATISDPDRGSLSTIENELL